jgi:NADH-quinone oxidoreductase subunit B
MTGTTGAAEASVLTTTCDRIFDWARRFGVRPVQLGLACCALDALNVVDALEMTPALDPGHGRARQGDLLIVAGPVNEKMASLVRRLWDEMPEPKGSLALDSCTACGTCGDPCRTYAVTRGIDRVIPVDVYVPGRPPRPEELLQGLLDLQKKMGLAEVRP